MLISIKNKNECVKGREDMEGKSRLECKNFLVKAFLGKQVGTLKVLRTFIFIKSSNTRQLSYLNPLPLEGTGQKWHPGLPGLQAVASEVRELCPTYKQPMVVNGWEE